MPALGVPELIIIFLIVILLFGATRLPQIGKGLGEGIRNFRKGVKTDDGPGPDRLDEKNEARHS
jgi:sec-independent protein translocase protein TatA